jgi:hypothetical protein
MAHPTNRHQGWPAAALLAVLTLSVFFLLQNYGPESTVRRYHEAVAKGDRVTQDQLIEETPDNPAAVQLSSLLTGIRRVADGYRPVNMDRKPGSVLLEVAYIRGNGIMARLPWIVHKRPGWNRWRISATDTLRWLHYYQGP